MSLPVQWLKEATAEAAEAQQYYAQRDELIAAHFLEELKAAENWISTMPRATGAGKRGTRFMVLRAFPYVVHFRIKVDCVQILAIAHGHRRPGYWHKRLAEN